MKHSTAIEEFITMKFLKYNIKYGVSIYFNHFSLPT